MKTLLAIALLAFSSVTWADTFEEDWAYVCSEMAVDCTDIAPPTLVEDTSLGAALNMNVLQGLLGYYDVYNTRNTIALDPLLRLFPDIREAVIVHEMAHYLDDWDGVSLYDEYDQSAGNGWCATEEKAHTVEHKWLIVHGKWRVAKEDRNWREWYGC